MSLSHVAIWQQLGPEYRSNNAGDGPEKTRDRKCWFPRFKSNWLGSYRAKKMFTCCECALNSCESQRYKGAEGKHCLCGKDEWHLAKAMEEKEYNQRLELSKSFGGIRYEEALLRSKSTLQDTNALMKQSSHNGLLHMNSCSERNRSHSLLSEIHSPKRVKLAIIDGVQKGRRPRQEIIRNASGSLQKIGNDKQQLSQKKTNDQSILYHSNMGCSMASSSTNHNGVIKDKQGVNVPGPSDRFLEINEQHLCSGNATVKHEEYFHNQPMTMSNYTNHEMPSPLSERYEPLTTCSHDSAIGDFLCDILDDELVEDPHLLPYNPDGSYALDCRYYNPPANHLCMPSPMGLPTLSDAELDLLAKSDLRDLIQFKSNDPYLYNSGDIYQNFMYS